ncbi:MAG TPA: hypothetical protein VLL52_09760 [Anaerolineae bacterium]|nr:hypothetical protein [Anaerolineae bacterium]
MDHETITSESGQSRLLYAAIAIMLMGLVLIVIFAYVIFFDPQPSDVDLTPTPFVPTATPNFVNTSAEDKIVVENLQDTITLTLDSPVSLSIGGRSFSLEPVPAEPGRELWAPTVGSEEQGVWLYGSVLNYVVGLASTPANEALLQSLTTGQEMRLRTISNREFGFTFDSRELLPVAESTIYRQNSPALTIILLNEEGESNDRLVVRGRYVLENIDRETNGTGGAELLELGETAMLGEGLQVTTVGTTYLFDRAEAPAGFSFFLVDYELGNIGTTAIDTSQLLFTLADLDGNQYVRNPVASQLGNTAPLAGVLGVGQAVRATVGYQIPDGLVSPSLRWRVERLNSGNRIEVLLPFTGGGGNTGTGTAVSLQQAEVSLDGTSLILVGQVTNLGTQAVVITEQEVNLNSQGTIYLILSTNPGFPWQINPGQTMAFSLTFQRPAADSAAFNVLNQSFQLNGLQ